MDHALRVFGYSGAIVAAAFLGALWPVYTDHRARQITFLAFAAGVMLGAGFFHLLPEAFEAGGPLAGGARRGGGAGARRGARAGGGRRAVGPGGGGAVLGGGVGGAGAGARGLCAGVLGGEVLRLRGGGSAAPREPPRAPGAA